MEKNKRAIWFIITVVFIVGGYYIFFANKQTEKKEEKTKREEISKGDLITKELADKYQAITDWKKNLTYTLQAQERLVVDKPILFQGYIEDVFNRDGKTFLRFSSSFFSSVDYVLELECNKQILDKVLSEQRNNENDPNIYLKSKVLRLLYNEYVVIARIQEVSKPVFALKGSVLNEDEVEIDIESSMLFTAKGTCVDIAYIGFD